MFLTVVTSSRSAGIGGGLTYEVPDAPRARQGILPGTAVRVPLRRKIVEGIVVEVLHRQQQTAFDLRSIKDVVGDAPLLTAAQMKTVRWMAEEYCCSLRQALQVWLPSPPWSRLLSKDRVGEGKRPKTSNPNSSPIPSPIPTPTLTKPQTSVVEQIRTSPRPSLLFGVTGSGKTEVYAALIADAVAHGKGAILLVPEILLTEHMIDRFFALLPRERIAVLHSRLTLATRRNAWRRIREGSVDLVIGSRSALFAPLQNLGLVILDEEHEWTYKNERTPRYHARETAEELCRNAQATLVLGSATPSLESWSRAKEGRYHLVRLAERYGGAAPPRVRVIDLADVSFGTSYPFSPALLTAIRDRLDRREQSILFLNRRGAATALLCLQCRRRVVSPASQLPFTVHHDRGGTPYLLDHASGLRLEVPPACPHCGSVMLREVGAGTQRIESLLRTHFPRARTLRADSDVLTRPQQMRSLLAQMESGQADILLGTQSVAKGLHLPRVTLAAVLLADVGMSLPHFRAGERTFQLLTQLTGRSGRGKPGEVIIQTFRPDAPEVRCAAEHAAERYLEEELALRTHAGYPPSSRMIRLLVRDPSAQRRAKELQQRLLSRALQTGSDARVSAAPTFLHGGREWHLLLRGTDPRALLHGLNLRDVAVDVDPVDTL